MAMPNDPDEQYRIAIEAAWKTAEEARSMMERSGEAAAHFAAVSRAWARIAEIVRA
jgi:hypothetical protein